MVNKSSLPTDGQSVFDLNSEKGTMLVLAALRTSDASAQDKNELRDLVFLYSNGGRDESVKLSLEKKIADLQLQPPTPTKTEVPTQAKPQPVIGSIRNAPTFTPTTPVKSTPPQPVAPPPAPEPVSTPVTPPPAPPAPEEPAPTPAPPAPEPTPTDAIPNATPSPQPATEQPQSTPPPASAEYLNRIRTIKSAINQKVGNPVNLVDLDNEIGREYMNSLLDAMKKLNTGVSPVAAMERLEKAYSQVEALLEDKEAPLSPKDTNEAVDTTRTTQSTPAPTPTAQSESQPPAVPQPVAKESQSPPPAPAPVTPPPEKPAQIPVPPTPSEVKASDSEAAVEANPVPINTATPDPVPVSPLEPTTPEPSTVPKSTKTPPVESRWESYENTSLTTATDDTPTPSPESSPSQPARKLSSLADLKNTTTESSVPISSSLKTAPPQVEQLPTDDPLRSKEVDEGLEQLLEEWPIFKKSGLFGTGPKGREHPLFKKIAPLQIPLLLAGRFEGATQEIRQSITDYMNGWRYEQGLIYEQGETFEHYLRRVIRHILDLQKPRV